MHLTINQGDCSGVFSGCSSQLCIEAQAHLFVSGTVWKQDDSWKQDMTAGSKIVRFRCRAAAGRG